MQKKQAVKNVVEKYKDLSSVYTVKSGIPANEHFKIELPIGTSQSNN